jgi:Ca-activated chloride channel family protein
MTEKDIDAKLSRQPIERYQWPLGVGILLLASSMLIGERRRGSGVIGPRVAAALAVLMSLGFARTSAAESPADLYAQGKYEDAQQAWQRLAEKNPKSVELAFNLGAAAYKNKDLDTALKAFSQALTTDDADLRTKAEYNLGNTLFQRGSAKKDIKTLEDALGHYTQALNLTPKDANAQHNKKVTEDLIAKLKEQQKEEQKQDKKQDEQKQDQQKQDKKDEEQKKDDQQKSDSKDQKDQKEQGKDQQKGDPQQQQGDGEKKDQPQSKPEDSKEKEGQQGEKKDQKDGQQNQQQQGQNGKPQEPQPAPGQDESGKKPSGELKSNPSQPQSEKEGQEEAAAEELAAAEGKMTERQAKALLDSLKSEDDRVRLLDPNERKRGERVLRDW